MSCNSHLSDTRLTKVDSSFLTSDAWLASLLKYAHLCIESERIRRALIIQDDGPAELERLLEDTAGTNSETARSTTDSRHLETVRS